MITPNPKTSGGARWNYLAAWALRARASPAATRRRPSDFVARALQERAGARLRRARLDDHLRPARHRRRAARLGERGASSRSSELGHGQGRDRRRRSLSILAEPPVAVVDKVVDKQGHARRRRRPTSSSSTRPRARRSPRSTTTARARPRPRWPRRRRSFPTIKLFTIDEVFGGWTKAQKTHFADGGVFDQIYAPGRDERADADAAARSRRASCPASGSTLGLHALLPVACVVLIPLSTLVPRRRAPSAGRASGRRSPSPRVARLLPADLRRLARGARSSTPSSASSSPGCSSATASPASGSSTRSSICPSRCRPPSPASRSPRSTRANGWLGPPARPLGHQGRLHAARHRHRAHLHRPALRRAHAAAGAREPRPGGRGGRGQPRREPARRPSARVILPALLPRPGSPASRSPSRARSASTARSSSSPATCR